MDTHIKMYLVRGANGSREMLRTDILNKDLIRESTRAFARRFEKARRNRFRVFNRTRTYAVRDVSRLREIRTCLDGGPVWRTDIAGKNVYEIEIST